VQEPEFVVLAYSPALQVVQTRSFVLVPAVET
jgi:hypothetical protein